MTDLAVAPGPPRVGVLLREWRRRRHLSQLELALEAGVSTRHLSFVETGRSRPSAEMVLHLAEQLEVPLRERNDLLLAAGYAPVYGQRGLDDPEMGPAREVIDTILRGHEPLPALVVDRHWGLVAGNTAVWLLAEGVAPELLEPPINVMRLTLHPDGLAPRILNLGQLRGHLLDQVARQAALSGDPALATLLEELEGYPGSGDEAPRRTHPAYDIAVPTRLRRGDEVLSFISTIATFGTAVDVTLAELSIETLFPADAATADAVRRLTATDPG
ncbi:MAG: helix-turn-helix transcriptional regulator [Solirubrobacteraceae bacterium]|jgi:transcriptional regulator with XRE-family HTH domain|nr:helix-turn-helix transcriptional regulator [Solirubrobacteraceae bacterium]MCU0312459.1 helix-turn-helix transcriptional regulator [Solirubrobacteraceae bacterium]